MALATLPLGPFSDGLLELKLSVSETLASTVGQVTKSIVVEMAALRAFSLLEDFLEEAFYLCMVATDSRVHSSGSVVDVSTRAEAELLLLSSREKREVFLDWLPFDRSEALADLYLKPGNLFERLRNRSVERRALKELAIVRNSVAHSSGNALEKLIDLANSRNYSVNRPADYLMSTRSGEMEILLLLTRLELIARALMAPTDLLADAILEPQDPFAPEQRGRPGKYLCRRCGQGKIHRDFLPLGRCPSCDVSSSCPECGKELKATSSWTAVIT